MKYFNIIYSVIFGNGKQVQKRAIPLTSKQVQKYTIPIAINQLFSLNKYWYYLSNKSKYRYENRNFGQSRNTFKKLATRLGCGLVGGWMIHKFFAGIEAPSFATNLKLQAATPINKVNSPVVSSNQNDIDVSPINKSFSRRRMFNFVADAYERVADGVVTVIVYKKDKFQENGERSHASNGSGFIIESDGHIITNYHVVAKASDDTLGIKLSNGKIYKGKLVKVERCIDLAIVKIEDLQNNLSPLILGSSDDVKRGEFVFAVGTPYGVDNTISSGIVANTKQRFSARTSNYSVTDINFLQTDIDVMNGGSGGPLVNIDGEVIGIVCSQLMKGYTLAIPISLAKTMIQKYKEQMKLQAENQSFSFKYVGVSLLPLNSPTVTNMGYQHPGCEGVFVEKVLPHSPASDVGLKHADVIVAMNGKKLNHPKDFYVNLKESGKVLCLKVLRGNIIHELKLTPER